MFISKAFAASGAETATSGSGVPGGDAVAAAVSSLVASTAAPGGAGMSPAPSPAGGTEMLLWNVGMIAALVAMFYLLLIRPQQKRFREHKDMIDSLKKGDRVLTGGGLIGKVDKIVSDTEILVDLGNGVKVSALRSTVQTRLDEPGKAS